MSIQISGTTVIDNSRNITNANNMTVGNVSMTGSTGNITTTGTVTAAGIDVPVSVSSFSPADGATNVSLTPTISITFNQNVIAVSGKNITLRSGSAAGTILQTIAATSASIAGGTVSITPSEFNYSTNVYVVVDDGAFKNTFNNSNALINTYDFTTIALNLGASYGGGNLICKSSPVRWIAAPAAAEVIRTFFARGQANAQAQTVSGCTGWFVPSISQMQNPGSVCRNYWENPKGNSFWSNTDCGYFYTIGRAWRINLSNGTAYCIASKTNNLSIRSFRCVTY